MHDDLFLGLSTYAYLDDNWFCFGDILNLHGLRVDPIPQSRKYPFSFGIFGLRVGYEPQETQEIHIRFSYLDLEKSFLYIGCLNIWFEP